MALLPPHSSSTTLTPTRFMVLCLAVLLVTLVWLPSSKRWSGTVSQSRADVVLEGDQGTPMGGVSRKLVDGALNCDLVKPPEGTLVKQVSSINMTLYPPHEDIVSAHLIRNGMWELEELKEIRYALDQPVDGKPDADPLFVDVGANVGWFTAVVASWGHRVVAFEAMQTNANMIRNTLCRNPQLKNKVELHEVALGQKDQKCYIWSFDINTGDGSIYCGEGLDSLKKFLVNNTIGSYTVKGEMQMRRLDDMLDEDIKVLKVDVEGAERDVLRGAARLLTSRRVHYVMTEYAPVMMRSVSGPTGPDQYRALLTALGYKCSTTGFRGPFNTMEEIGAVQQPIINLYCVRVPDAHYNQRDRKSVV